MKSLSLFKTSETSFLSSSSCLRSSLSSSELLPGWKKRRRMEERKKERKREREKDWEGSQALLLCMCLCFSSSFFSFLSFFVSFLCCPLLLLPCPESPILFFSSGVRPRFFSRLSLCLFSSCFVFFSLWREREGSWEKDRQTLFSSSLAVASLEERTEEEIQGGRAKKAREREESKRRREGNQRSWEFFFLLSTRERKRERDLVKAVFYSFIVGISRSLRNTSSFFSLV